MVIDSSAVIAILIKEPEASDFVDQIIAAEQKVLSAANFLEASIVIERRNGAEGGRDLDMLVYKAGIEIVPFDLEQAEVARRAWRQFGKGRHRAELNFG